MEPKFYNILEMLTDAAIENIKEYFTENAHEFEIGSNGVYYSHKGTKNNDYIDYVTLLPKLVKNHD